MKIEPAVALVRPAEGSGKEAGPAKLKSTAQQFEALLISQMMKTARESRTGGWGGETEDQAGESMMDMGEQQLSQLLAAGGGLGLAKLVIQGISVKSDKPS